MVGKVRWERLSRFGHQIQTLAPAPKVNERTLTTANKKNGKVTVTGQIVVSADGKSRTVTLNGTTPKGKKFKNVAVYDKQ